MVHVRSGISSVDHLAFADANSGDRADAGLHRGSRGDVRFAARFAEHSGRLRRIAIQEHERSETIVANAVESIFTFDEKGTILSCNRAATELFGVDVGGVIGKPIQTLVPQLPRRFDFLPAEIRTDATSTGDGLFPVQISVSEYPSQTQRTRIAIVRDLTLSKKAEEERLTMARETEALRAQQMTTLAQLATGVAHEIRNPLTSIKMLIQVNRAKFADEGLPTDDLELVEQEIRRMERSVNSLLDYARPENSEFAEFAIQEAVNRTVQLIEGRCHLQNIQLTVQSPSDIRVCGDSAQIQQLLLNVALNALDAMPEGGALEISVRSDGAAVEITVSDTGTGIQENVLDRLFTPFVTTKTNGVGLGLGICRRIAQAHHGKLSGANRVGGGAQFRLVLPMVATPQDTSQSHSSTANEPSQALSSSGNR